MSHLTCELSSASGTEQGNAQVGKKGSIKLESIYRIKKTDANVWEAANLLMTLIIT